MQIGEFVESFEEFEMELLRNKDIDDELWRCSLPIRKRVLLNLHALEAQNVRLAYE